MSISDATSLACLRARLEERHNRPKCLAVFLTLLFLLLSPVFAAASAQAETRTLKLYNVHTKERVDITFKKNGRYIPAGLRQANNFLRDWRRNESTKIDPHLLDLVWEVYQKVGAKEPINVVSSYRSPATNNMLRQRTRGVAKKSQHMLGKAMDFYIPGVDLAKLRATGLRAQVGGVGYYPTSGSPFVHMDTGNVRHWPPMTRSQLARVFPDGKTIHIPSDGKPMSGYKLALAEIETRQANQTPIATASATPRNSNGPRPLNTRGQSLNNSDGRIVRPGPNQSGRGFFASLFGGGADEQEDEEEISEDKGAPVQVASTPSPVQLPSAANAPIPVSAPATSVPATAVATTAESLTQDRIGALAARQAAVAAAQPPAVDVATGASPATSATPFGKPQGSNSPAQVATTQPAVPAYNSQPPAPNTLDAQRVAMQNGSAPTASAPLQIDNGRFEIAAVLPMGKPSELRHGNTDKRQTNEAADPIAAIAAATNDAAPHQAETAAPEKATLAYAGGQATAAVPLPVPSPALSSRMIQRWALEAKVLERQKQRQEALHKPAATTEETASTVIAEIHDPLAGFARAPDETAPQMIAGEETARNRTLASLRHPDQRVMTALLVPGNRFMRDGFTKAPYGVLRADRFAGTSTPTLPVLITQ